jgi:hypothetical protein
MTRMWPSLAIAGVLLAPGCLGLLAGDAPVTPTGAHEAWTATAAEPWILVTRGCGFCYGGADRPEVQTLVVYEDGHVLWFRFGSGRGDGPPNVTTVPALAAYQPEIERVVAQMDTWYINGGEVRAHEVAVSRLLGDERSAVNAFLTHAVTEAGDPGPPNYGCDDCGGIHVQVLGDKDLDVELARTEPGHPEYGNYRDGDAWDRIVRQAELVEEWVTAWKAP